MNASLFFRSFTPNVTRSAGKRELDHQWGATVGSRIAVTLIAAGAILLMVIVFSCHCALRSVSSDGSASQEAAPKATFRPDHNILRVDEGGQFQLNGTRVDAQAISQALIDVSTHIARDGERPLVVIRGSATMTYLYIRRAIDILHSKGCSRIMLDDESGQAADLSSVWMGKPTPAKYTGALIIVLSSDGHSPDHTTINGGEKVIIKCTDDSRHGDLVHLLVTLHARGVTNVCVDTISRDDLAEATPE